MEIVMKNKKLTLLSFLAINFIVCSNPVTALPIAELKQEFKLISNDGLQWDEVTDIPSHVNFRFREVYPLTPTRWDFDTKFTLYKGNCENSACGGSSHPVVLSRDDLSDTYLYNVGPLSPNLIFGSTGFFSLSGLKNTCNKALNNPDIIYDDIQTKASSLLTLHTRGTQTYTPNVADPTTEYVDEKIKVWMDANIFCKSIGTNPGAIAANEIKVFLATGTAAVTQPTPGTECSMTKFTTRIKTNRAGTLPVHTYQQIGIGPIVKKEKQITSTLQADGSFIGRFEEWIPVGQSSVVRVKAEEADNPYVLNDVNLSTQWKDISLVCAGAGGSGLSGLSPGGSTDPGTPSTHAGSVSMNTLPNHTGGGAVPTGLSDKGQSGQKTAYEYKLDGVMISSYDVSGSGATKKPTVGGLRSDGELVQAKKPRGLLGHELTHNSSRTNKGLEKQKGSPVLASNQDMEINTKKPTSASHSDLYIKSLSVAGGNKLQAKNAMGYKNGTCLFEISYTVGRSSKGKELPGMATLSNLTLKRGTTIIKRHKKQNVLKNKQKIYKELLPLVSGKNMLTLIIDPKNKVKESNEKNNKKTVAVNVSGSCKGK